MGMSTSPRDAYMIVGDKKVFCMPKVTDSMCDNSGVLGARPVPVAEADEQLPAPYGSNEENV